MTMPENSDMIGLTRKSNRAVCAARSLAHLFGLVCKTTT